MITSIKKVNYYADSRYFSLSGATCMLLHLYKSQGYNMIKSLERQTSSVTLKLKLKYILQLLLINV